MESLALLVTLIVLPAMFGGPIVLLLSFWKPVQISRIRKSFIIGIAAPSALVGIFLVAGRISRGATIIGLIGLISGLIAIWRVTLRQSRNSNLN